MASTTASPEQWGPRLYTYLESYWRAHATNPNAWSDKHPGIQAATVSRWRTGTEPSLRALRAVADALEVPLVDVLAAAGVVAEGEGGGSGAPFTVPSIDAAIAQDPTLSMQLRVTLRQLVDAFREVESGRSVEVGSSQTRRRARK